jgi:UDP-glucuronate 4-epimerase
MKHVLITGGAGFIGSHLTDHLLDIGVAVRVFDNFDPYYPRDQKLRNLAAALENPRFDLVEGDIRDRLQLRAALADHPDLVVHLAARAGVRPSLEQPELYAEVNVQGTIALLEECRAAGVKRLLFASSSSVYGNRNGEAFKESDSTDHQLSPYGATKKAGELICHVYSHLYGFSIACLRFFTVYGPRQRPDLAIRKFISRALLEEPLPVFGDGTTSRDYTHISDIVGGLVGAARWVQEQDGRYGIFNLGSNAPVTMRELLAGIETCIGNKLAIEYLPAQPGDVLRTFADTSLAESELGFTHSVPFIDGLRDMILWVESELRTEGKL